MDRREPTTAKIISGVYKEQSVMGATTSTNNSVHNSMHAEIVTEDAVGLPTATEEVTVLYPHEDSGKGSCLEAAHDHARHATITEVWGGPG